MKVTQICTFALVAAMFQIAIGSQDGGEGKQQLLRSNTILFRHQQELRLPIATKQHLRRRMTEQVDEGAANVDNSSGAAAVDPTDANADVTSDSGASGAANAEVASDAGGGDSNTSNTAGSSSPQDDEEEEDPEQKCIQGFEQLAFSLVSFDRYDEFFHDDSSVLISSSGHKFDGRQRIEDYIKFETPFSPYFLFPEPSESIDSTSSSTPPVFFGVDTATGICHFTVPLCSSVTVEGEAGKGDNDNTDGTTSPTTTSTKLTVMAQISYDSIQNYIPTISIMYNEQWINSFYGRNSLSTRNFQCQNLLS